MMGQSSIPTISYPQPMIAESKSHIPHTPSLASQPLIITILLFYVFSMSTSQENRMLKSYSPVC